MGQTLEKLNRPQEAFTAYCKELAWGAFEEPTKAALRAVYPRLQGSADGLESAERIEVNELAAQRADRDSDLVSDVDEDLGRFDLLDESGSTVDLKRYRGQIVAIDFWATWCEPCRAVMQHTAELQQRFAGKVAVVAPALDPEETHAQAAEFLKKMNYGFTLVFDDERRRDIKLPFIPARLLLDQKGRLRFMEFGHTPESAALFERKLASLVAADQPQ